ncbi:MAG: hypothetical protein BWK76_15945 [Desulfobulbaceae bacterium A2]|nr:MAG: hypothetical protein BWK76_15945 [Desulfobulbaceae bacterium A2]
MTVFAYAPTLRLAFSDDLSFPDEETARASSPPAETPLTINEWQPYFIKTYGDTVPTLLHDKRFARQLSGNLWEVNYRNFVGLSRIGNISLVVRNQKITDTLYRDLLDELAVEYSTLVFDFGSPVGQHYEKKRAGTDTAFVEYLFLCKYLLHGTPDLEAMGELIVRDPHRKHLRELHPCSIEECQAGNSDIVNALVNSPMMRLPTGHALRKTHLGRLLSARTRQDIFPVRAANEINYLTVDTAENRFILFFLRMLLAKIETLQTALANRSGSYFNPDIDRHLEMLRHQLDQFSAHNMWRDVGEMRHIPANSQVLQRKEGYRQLFRLYSLLQLATHCDFLSTDFRNLVEIKDLPTIYEYWCFFQIKKVLDALSRASAIRPIIDKNPLTHELSSGLCIDYACGAQLRFNTSYHGSTGVDSLSQENAYTPCGISYSHTLRPDIVITQGHKKLIFDAKYKGHRTGFYCEGDDGTIQRWKDEDIDKMHTYREAILGVMGSFILYPGSQNMLHPCHTANSYAHGVGALALRPGQQNDMQAIRELIMIFKKQTGETDARQ